MAVDQMYADAVRELREVKAERDALAFQLENKEGLVRRAIEKEEQYDALAAHVEDLHARIRALYVGGRSIVNLDSRLATLLCLKPETSLDRLIAEKQAEAIDKWSAVIIQVFQVAHAKHAADPNYPRINLQMVREICCDMSDDADRLRRQSKEAS